MLKQVVLQFRFMKIQLFLLVIVAAFSLVGYSHAEVYPQEDPSLYDVSLQLQLRNSEGQLITYIEPTIMFISNIKLVHEFLDTKENKKIIEKDGEKLELIQYEQIFRFDKTAQYSTLQMRYNNDYVLLFRHDGYFTSPGDTLDAFWKITRTIQ
jgi:hypothetical protein